jgi:putative transposase
VKCRNLRHDGTAKALRVIERAGKWYAQLVVDDGLEAPPKRPVNRAVGIDVGLTHFATMSDGSQIENPRYYRQAEKRLRRWQRVVSRRKKGSRRRWKAVQQVQRCHERVRNLRKNFLHHASKRLVNEYDLIAVENLNVKGLARTRLAKSVMDAGWSTFNHMLKYKAENAGASVVAVNPAHTTSDCSGCGNRQKKTLSEREHVCTCCGLVLDRDHNAALNILAAGRAVTARGEMPEVGALVEAGSSN